MSVNLQRSKSPTNNLPRRVVLSVAVMIFLTVLCISSVAAADVPSPVEPTPVAPTPVAPTPVAPSWYGYGTEAQPYLIKSAEDLKLLADRVNAGNSYENTFFRVNNDIDMISVCDPWNGSWTPIGNWEFPFMGTFDGYGHVLYSLYIDDNAPSLGLFGETTNATIKNLGLEDVCIDGTDTKRVGSIVGSNSARDGGKSIITNCYATGNISGDSCGYVGGLVGENYVFNNGQIVITDCFSKCAVWGEIYVGGITGSNFVSAGSITINNCLSSGVFVDGDDSIGGIAGINIPDNNPNSAVISNCVVLNYRINGSESVGRIVGDDRGTSINNYALNTLSIANDGNDVSRETTWTRDFYEDLGWDFDNVWMAEMATVEHPLLRVFVYGPTPAPAPAPTVTPDIGLRLLSSDTTALYNINGSAIYEKYQPVIFAIDIADAEVRNNLGYPHIGESDIDIIITDSTGTRYSFVEWQNLLSQYEYSISIYQNTTHISIKDGELYDWLEKYGTYDAHVEYTNPEGQTYNSNSVRFEFTKANSEITLSGAGTEANPYKITSAADLVKLANAVNSGSTFEDTYFLVTQDIDISAYDDWEPIGNFLYSLEHVDTESLDPNELNNPIYMSYRLPFCGIFDGGNHVISGLTIQPDNERLTLRGLFGYINSNAVLKNIRLAGVSVMDDGEFQGALVGGIYADHDGPVVIENCSASGEFMAYGGLIGRAYTSDVGVSPITITDCSVFIDGKVRGGLIGYVDTYGYYSPSGYVEDDAANKTITVERCYAIFNDTDGVIYPESTSNQDPIFPGYMPQTPMVSDIGMLIGGISLYKNNTLIIHDSYVKSMDSDAVLPSPYYGTHKFVISHSYAHSVADGNYTVYHSENTDAQYLFGAKQQSYYEENGWDFANVWKMGDDGYPVLRNAGGFVPPVVPDDDDPVVPTPVEPEIDGSIPWDKTDYLPTTNGTYHLTTDVRIYGGWDVPTGETNLDLNGHSISSIDGRTSYIISIYSGGTLNLSDSVGTGAILGSINQMCCGVSVNSGGNFIMYGGSITGHIGRSGGGVAVIEGNFTFVNGNISGNIASEGGGVYVLDGNFTMYGGTISNNSVTGTGEGVYIGGNALSSLTSGGTFTLVNGSIVNNTVSYGYSSGVHVNTGTFVMDGGIIKGNTGSGVSEGHAGEFILNDGIICDNLGSGVSASVKFTMNGGIITNNTAMNSGSLGGGVYVGGDFVMNDGMITANYADQGPGVYLYSSNFTMNGGVISENAGKNSYSLDGGVTLSTENSLFVMNGGDITSNVGNGVTINTGTFLLVNGNITENIRGIRVGRGNFTLSGGNVSNNAYSNLYLSNNGIFAIDSNGLADNVLIGISTDSYPSDDELIALTGTNNADYSRHFYSDNIRFFVINRDNVLYLSTSLGIEEILNTTATANAIIDARIGYRLSPSSINDLSAPLFIRGNLSTHLNDTVVVNKSVNGVEKTVPATLNSDGTVNIASGSIAGAKSITVTFVGRKIGDVTGDKKVNTLDAARILQASAKIITFDRASEFYGDVTKDGKTNTLDAARILQYSAHMVDDDYEVS